MFAVKREDVEINKAVSLKTKPLSE
jgi:hypothetical protein